MNKDRITKFQPWDVIPQILAAKSDGDIPEGIHIDSLRGPVQALPLLLLPLGGPQDLLRLLTLHFHRQC